MDKLDALWAMEQIRQLKARYFRFLDSKDWDGMRTIWTEDAVFDARASQTIGGAGQHTPSGSEHWIYEGRDAIVEFIAAVAIYPTVHHGHCHEIEVLSATEARGIIAMEDLLWRDTGRTLDTSLHGFGHYHEEYRCVEGNWRIARSRLSRLNVMTRPGTWD